MNSSGIILRLGAVVLLGGYLLLKHRQRVRIWTARDYPHWPGRSLDAAALHPRLERIRQNYLAELHSSPHTASVRANLVARARRTLGSLQYFRDRDASRSAAAKGSADVSSVY